MEGKWWIENGRLFNELTEMNPPLPNFDIEEISIDQIVEIKEKEMILIDERGMQYKKLRVNNIYH